MSLVSTWVQAVDGRYYKNPIIYGKNYFICFDDEEPPELIVESDYVGNVQDLIAGFGDRVFYDHNSIRLRPPTFKEFFSAKCYFFTLIGKIPIPNKADGFSSSSPTDQCVIYSFDGQW